MHRKLLGLVLLLCGVWVCPASAQSSGATADERFVTSGPPTLRQATNRVGIFSTLSGASTQSGWRIWEVSYVAGQPQITWWNGHVTAGVEAGNGGTMTIVSNIEYPHGVWTAVKCGGGPCVLADNAILTSDPVPVVIPAYTPFRLVGSFTMGTGGFVPSMAWSNSIDRANGDEYQAGSLGVGHEADDTVLGSGSANGVFPQAIMMVSNLQVTGIVGDSKVAGVNDTIPDASGGRGQLGRALAKFGPQLNYGVPGDQAVLYVASHAKRLALLQLAGASRMWLELGVNDIFAGSRTSTQLLVDRATIRGLLPLSWSETTITPETNSTDNWQTAANQTVVGVMSNAQRVAFNDFMRATPPAGIYAIADLAQAVETNTATEHGPVVDGGVWIGGVSGPGGSGVHETSLGYQLEEPYVEQTMVVRR